MGEFKQHSTGWLAKLFVESLLKWLGLAKYIVCISKATRDDLLRISKVVKPDNASVIYMGLNYNYYPADIKESESCLRKLGLKTNLKFFLHVGKDNWYKNRMGLLDIFRNIIEIQDSEDFHLVFAGKDLSTNMVKYITKYKLTNKVISLEGIDNEALRCLYSSAVALIFPSFAEGFGWPIIEAQACGCPVFTSKLPPMTEVGGAAAVYFDPNATKEAARVILEGISDRENLRVRGFENIKRFTAEKMIQEYESVYRKEMTKI
jgi:glycosyltransferase involved in cell wall biosynthesis